MPDKSISYRVNPLPQADYPENLYKRSLTQTRLPESPIQDAAPNTNRSTESPLQPRPEPSRPYQSPTSRQQAAEAQAIASRVQDRSRSTRLEYLLRRQQSKRYSHYDSSRQPMMELEHLAIARRSDQFFQIVIQGTKTPFSRHVFETMVHCHEAAAELECKFELGGMLEFLDAEIQEHVEAIILAAAWRERVEIELAGT
jgi:hypothetical protein